MYLQHPHRCCANRLARRCHDSAEDDGSTTSYDTRVFPCAHHVRALFCDKRRPLLSLHRVVAAVVAQLVALNDLEVSNDSVLDIWVYQVCVQCVQALSLITACIPYLKPFLESLQAGVFRVDDAAIRLYGSVNTSKKAGGATRRAYLELTRE